MSKAKIISIADYDRRRRKSSPKQTAPDNIIHVRFTPRRRPLPPAA
jgi:hypothetical protein